MCNYYRLPLKSTKVWNCYRLPLKRTKVYKYYGLPLKKTKVFNYYSLPLKRTKVCNQYSLPFLWLVKWFPTPLARVAEIEANPPVRDLQEISPGRSSFRVGGHRGGLDHTSSWKPLKRRHFVYFNELIDIMTGCGIVTGIDIMTVTGRDVTTGRGLHPWVWNWPDEFVVPELAGSALPAWLYYGWTDVALKVLLAEVGDAALGHSYFTTPGFTRPFLSWIWRCLFNIHGSVNPFEHISQ